MLAWLRRTRLVALALLLCTPGLLGTVLQAAHPCPVDYPWAADAASHTEHGEGAGHHGDRSGSPGPHDEPCQCVGACQPGPAAPPVRAPATVTAFAEPQAPRPHAAGDLLLPLGEPLDRLPPALAPPLG